MKGTCPVSNQLVQGLPGIHSTHMATQNFPVSAANSLYTRQFHQWNDEIIIAVACLLTRHVIVGKRNHNMWGHRRLNAWKHFTHIMFQKYYGIKGCSVAIYLWSKNTGWSDVIAVRITCSEAKCSLWKNPLFWYKTGCLWLVRVLCDLWFSVSRTPSSWCWAAVQTQGFQIEGWEHSAVSVVITGSPFLLG